MPTTTTWLAFVVATLAMLLIPGPSVLFVVARSLEHGRWAGLYAMLGLETGALLHVLVTAAGLSALLASSELALLIVRYAGAAYLLYLGVQQLLHRGGDVRLSAAATSRSRGRIYLDGVLVDLLNPKTALFFIAFLPQFIEPTQGAAAKQIVALGLCFVVLAAICDGAYAIVAGGLASRIQASPQARSRIGSATGGVYVGLAGLAALT